MHVFISHSRVNSSAALRLCEELRQRGVETWLDVRDLAPGAEWDKSVAEAIQAADGFVFVIGPPGSSDRWQQFEWQEVVNGEYYLDRAKPLLPVLIGEPELPGFLKTRQVLVLGDDPKSCSDVADKVMEALRDPAASVDEEKMELGREARRQALKSLQEYTEALGQKDVKRAGIRAIE
jgi:hypothetical protein